MILYSLVKHCSPICLETDEIVPHNRTDDSTVPAYDILYSMLPPRTWKKDGKTWIQYVSSAPATPSDISKLKEKLDKAVKEPDIKIGGICEARHKLHSSAFDEIIRQVTISCAERGLLLLRINEEMKLTLKSFQQIIESCFGFAIRKALLTGRDDDILVRRLNCLIEQNSTLKEERKTIQNQMMKVKEQKRSYEGFESTIIQLENTNQNLKEHLRQHILNNHK